MTQTRQAIAESDEVDLKSFVLKPFEEYESRHERPYPYAKTSVSISKSALL